MIGQPVTFTVQVAPISPSTGHPTGTVTFFADGNSLGTAAVDPATGQASISTASLGSGSHAITADYSGDSNYTASQTASSQSTSTTQITVSPASTATVLSTVAVRDKHGKIVKVMLESRVTVVSPGVGTSTGDVTYYRGGHRVRHDGAERRRQAVLTLKSAKALKKKFSVRYDGNANFNPSASATVAVTKKTLALVDRPATAFLKHRKG